MGKNFLLPFFGGDMRGLKMSRPVFTQSSCTCQVENKNYKEEL
jgi:hypothetical protein